MSPLTKFSFYPIGRLSIGPPRGMEDEDFDLKLPFEILPDVQIEDVSSLIRKGEFDIHKPGLGEYRIRELERIKYAIIHRYPQHGLDPDTGKYLVDTGQTNRSRKLVQEMAACLRIIRPVTVYADFCEGEVADNGELYNFAFNEPEPNFSLPINQRLFAFRNEDVQLLRSYAPLFRSAMVGSFWKFRMAVQMYDTGYFQTDHWKIRFFLWTSVLEALFTSQNPNREHSGSRVAKERIKEMLGPGTSVYPPEELSRLEANPSLTVADVLDEIYCLRNHIAHGDMIPGHYFQTTGRSSLNGPLVRIDMLIENISFIVRRSLLKIMKDNLLAHFRDAASSEAYFDTLQLTNSAISMRFGRSTFTCPS